MTKLEERGQNDGRKCAPGLLKSKVRYEAPAEGANMALELLAAFKRHSRRTLLVDARTRRQLTGGQLLDEAGRVACSLVSRLGLEPGAAVLTICDHTGDAVVFTLGVVLAGGALYGSSASDGVEEWRSLCEILRPQLIVTHARCHQQVLELKRRTPSLAETRLVWLDNPMKAQNGEDANNNQDADYYLDLAAHDQVSLLDDLLAGPLDEALLEEVARKRIRPSEHVLTYMLTSGSTGRPKVVPSTHEELMHGLHSMHSARLNAPEDDEAADEDVNERLLMPMDENSVLAGTLPLDHGAGANTIFLSLSTGSKIVIVASDEVDEFWQCVHDHRISMGYASTAFSYKLLLRLKQLIEAKQTNRWRLDSLRNLTCCGAKLAFEQLVREVCSVYTRLSVRQAYGCTEVGFISLLSGAGARQKLHSVGLLMPGLVAKVVKPEKGDAPCAADEPGELLLWSRSNFRAYKCAAGDSAERIYAQCHDRDGFYRTGDQVHVDASGSIYVHGRIKDTLVLDTDWKILPAELEALIDQHPLVEFSQVVGLPNPDLPCYHLPKAFVKLISVEELRKKRAELGELGEKLARDERAFIADHIYKFVAERTAAPKHLRGGVRILDAFPRVGLLNKIDRKALRALD